MNTNRNNRMWRFWTSNLIGAFILVFLLSSCASQSANAPAESLSHLAERLRVTAHNREQATVHRDTKPAVEYISEKKSEAVKKKGIYTEGKIKPYYYPECTISIREDLIQSPEDKNFLHTAFMSHIYYLGAADSLGTLDTEFFFKTVIEKYEETKDRKIVERSKQLNKEISRDGVRYDVGYFKTYTDGMPTYVSMVMVPQKNMFLTHILSFHHVEPERKSALEELELMHRNIIFHRGSQDYVSGNTFLVGENSKISLQDDGTFQFYRSQNDLVHDYYLGEYEVFYGEEAFEKLTKLPQYNIKREDLEEELENYMSEGVSLEKDAPIEYLSNREEEEVPEFEDVNRYDICKDTFYAIILHNKELVKSPSQKDKMGHDTLYVGYYIEEEKTLSLLNANAGSSAIWRFMKKSQKGQ